MLINLYNFYGSHTCFYELFMYDGILSVKKHFTLIKQGKYIVLLHKSTGQPYSLLKYDNLYQTIMTDIYYYNPDLYTLYIEIDKTRYGYYYIKFYCEQDDIVKNMNNCNSLDAILYDLITVQKSKQTTIYNKEMSFHKYLPANDNTNDNTIDNTNDNFIKKLTNRFPNLFDYQKKNIIKMCDIENNMNRSINMSVGIDIDDKIICYNLNTFKFNISNDYIKCNYTIKGGILADEMGLGKTLTLLATTFINNNTTIKTGKINDNIITTKANLIIVPSHLADQWVSEIKKYMPEKICLCLYTKSHHMKLTFNDIINCDYLIVTQQFLLNFNYYIRYEYEKVTPSTYKPAKRITHIFNEFAKGIKEKKQEYLNKNGPLLELFNFQRVIIDEGHEIFENTFSTPALNNYMNTMLCNYINGNIKWYVSGTPFTTKIGIENSLEFLNFEWGVDNYINFTSNNGYVNGDTIYSNVLKDIMIRSLKNDVIDEISVPGYNEKTFFIELNEGERKLYEMKKKSYDKKVLQQLCCHPLIVDSFKKILGNDIVDIDEMQTKLITHHNNQITTYTKKLQNLDPNKTEYAMLSKNYKTIISESQYIINILNKINGELNLTEDDCIICYDKLNDPVMTPCGHIYCKSCITESLKYNNVCPQCRAQLQSKDLYSITKKKKAKPKQVTNSLIEKYGSKLGTLITMIKKYMLDEKAKIIVFSQWDDMLSLIGKTLAENGVANTFIKGNVYHRNNAIKKFKYGVDSKGKTTISNVIMLSLENAASGTNLMEANYIFFVEPINNTIENCQAIEGQAIGRVCRIGQKKKVDIIRLITKDTIEEEIYNKNYKNNTHIETTINNTNDSTVDVIV